LLLGLQRIWDKITKIEHTSFLLDTLKTSTLDEFLQNQHQKLNKEIEYIKQVVQGNLESEMLGASEDHSAGVGEAYNFVVSQSRAGTFLI
jgi:hypothetical protein